MGQHQGLESARKPTVKTTDWQYNNIAHERATKKIASGAQLQQCNILFNSCLKLFMVAELCLNNGISKQQQ